ncbi:hypothetical protein [Janthinobacterium sp. UMAB-60]|uniref:hypothetical protein n=1 Tax=Janthinobacterium sp. UMAB-60 TaxID=1365365 RepID=UPI001C599383|nr:hypothetical protein [Janthinobacterium sp. UMAB-60]
MSVTQNYKTFKLSASDDAIRYIVAAVMRQLVADKDRVESAKDSALVDFLRREIATGNTALTALNCTSGRATGLEGELLQTVIQELDAMRDLVVGGYVMPGMPVSTTERRVRTMRLKDALWFLESMK